MNSLSVMGLISSIALMFPVLLILSFRLATYKKFPAIFIYYLLTLTYNLARIDFIPVNNNIVYYWNTVNNFLDAPLVLYFLSYFTNSVSLTRKMHWLIAGILVFQTAVIAIAGFNSNAVSIFLGPGIALVFAFSLHFFVRNAKITISHHKGLGKAVMTASFLFAYGCYAIIYLVYYVFKLPNIVDTFIIYFSVVTISSILMGIGIIAESKRIRKLNELLQTRKELSVIYKNESNPVRRIRTVALDFDKDPWV